MAERKNHSALTAQERLAFVNAVLQLKANGGYDRYVREHQRVFELGGPAHGGPAFLPWHREYLRQLEVDLQRIAPTVTLPYWDWTVDRSAGPPLWADDFMGGGGDGPDDIVTSGPFALAGGRWRLTVTQPPLDPGPALRRTLGPTPPLPTAAQ
ncbi:MAG TPA: tyrosinase family protein, partial [Egibacteraceae bacterium]|nr:tyrosinase family protein [Egibacteraceae bacterium]